MFNSLKKRLKETVEKITKTIKEEKKHEERDEKIREKEHEYTGIGGPTADESRKEAEQAVGREEEKIKEEIVGDYVRETVVEAEVEKVLEEAEKEEIKKEIREEFEEEIAEKTERDERPSADAEKEDIEKKVGEKIEKIEKEIDEGKKKKRSIFQRLFETTLEKRDVDIVLKELKFALLENDVAVEVVDRISEDVSNELVDKSVRRDKIQSAIKDALGHAMLDVMKQENVDVEKRIKNKDGVFTVVFLGFNGTGKTTTLAKFAKKFEKFQPVVAAGDTFRAASIEQLEEHSKKLGFRVVKHKYGADSAAVIFDAKKAALAAGSKLVLADTAGRSHSNVNLMDELKKVCRVISPDMKILVLDSVTGNDIYEQSRLFDSAVGVDAIILTKADVYDKGGAALSATYTIKKPILYLGTGQDYGDLKDFRPEEIVDNLLK